jgi:tetratricopeptide (TPR) repeat protein
VNRRSGFVIALCLTACSTHRDSPTGNLPSIPELKFAGYRPQIRTQVEQAYKAVQADPKNPENNGHLGMLLHAFEQTVSAEVFYRRAHLLDPKPFQWAYYLGLVEALEGKNNDAAASLQDAIRIDPQYVPARIKLAEVLLILGRLDESRQTSEALVKDDPQMAPGYYWLGRVASASGKLSQAEDQYRKACEAWPAYGTAHYALALAYQKSGQPAEAGRHMAAYQKYHAESDPQPEDPMLEAVRALDNSALAHLMKSVDYQNARQFDQAIAEDEEALRQDPKLVQADANLISLYARAGEPEKAEQAYRAAVAINANLPQAHYDYGVFLVSRGHYPEAEAAFRKALDSSPHYAEAHSNLGAMFERRGKIEDATREYRAAIEDKSNFRQAHYQLGRLLLMQKKTAEAIDNLRQSLTPEDESTPRFKYALGVAYAEVNDFANAKEYLQQASAGAAALGQDELANQIRMVLGKVEQSASLK